MSSIDREIARIDRALNVLDGIALVNLAMATGVAISEIARDGDYGMAWAILSAAFVAARWLGK